MQAGGDAHLSNFDIRLADRRLVVDVNDPLHISARPLTTAHGVWSGLELLFELVDLFEADQIGELGEAGQLG